MYFFFWGFKRKIFSRVIQLQNSISKPTLQIKIKKTVKKPPPFNQSQCEIHGKLPNFLGKRNYCSRPSFNLKQLADEPSFMINSAEHSHCLFFLDRTVEVFGSMWFCQPVLGCCRWLLFVLFFLPLFFFLLQKVSENYQHSHMRDCNKECWELPWDIMIAVSTL